MGGLHTWLELEEVTAESLNLFLTENSIPKFPTSAARDAAILAPVDGQASFQVDSGSLTVWLAARSAWFTPFNLPRGAVSTTYATAVGGVARPPSFSFGTSLAGTDPLSWNLQKNRRYRFDWVANHANGTVVTGLASVYFVANGAAIGTATTVAKNSETATLQTAPLSGFLLWDAVASGGQNFKLYAQASAGTTGGQTISDVAVSCVDLGPNGNP